MTQLRDDPISIEETPIAFMADELYGEDEATKQLSRDEIEEILSTESQANPPPQDVLDKADPHRRISVSSSEVQAALKDAGKIPVPPPPPVLDQSDPEPAPPAPRPAILPAPARKAAAEFRSLPSEQEEPEPPSAVFRPPSIEVEAAEPPSLEFALGNLAKSAREEVEESSKPVSAVVQTKAAVVGPEHTGGVGRWVLAFIVLIIGAGVGAALLREDPAPKKLAAPRYHQPAPLDLEAASSVIDAAAVELTPDVATPDTARPDAKTKQSVDVGASVVDAAAVVDTMKKRPRPRVKKVRPKKRSRPKRPRRPRKPRKPKRPKTIDPFAE